MIFKGIAYKCIGVNIDHYSSAAGGNKSFFPHFPAKRKYRFTTLESLFDIYVVLITFFLYITCHYHTCKIGFAAIQPEKYVVEN